MMVYVLVFHWLIKDVNDEFCCMSENTAFYLFAVFVGLYSLCSGLIGRLICIGFVRVLEL